MPVWGQFGCLARAICIGTNQDDEQTPLININILHPSIGLNGVFLAQHNAKAASMFDGHVVIVMKGITCKLVPCYQHPSKSHWHHAMVQRTAHMLG